MVDKLSPNIETFTISHGEIKVIFNKNGSVEVHEKGKLTFHAIPERALVLSKITPVSPSDWSAERFRSCVKQNIATWPEDWQKAMTPDNETYVAFMRAGGLTYDPGQEPEPTVQSAPKPCGR
jgi:hypothetical protein